MGGRSRFEFVVKLKEKEILEIVTNGLVFTLGAAEVPEARTLLRHLTAWQIGNCHYRTEGG